MPMGLLLMGSMPSEADGRTAAVGSKPSVGTFDDMCLRLRCGAAAPRPISCAPAPCGSAMRRAGDVLRPVMALVGDEGFEPPTLGV